MIPSVFHLFARLYQSSGTGVHLSDMTQRNPAIAARRRAAAAAATAVLLSLALLSCSSRIGWGLVLWTVKGTTARAGSIVPLYLKSNITKEFVIGIRDEKNRETRVEVPIWQIEQFSSRRAAERRLAGLGELSGMYMIAQRDGLPVRAKPDNISRREYRLHQGEMVKILDKAEGEAVYTGGAALQGDWYLVLTMDGTRGYVFSATMSLYDESQGEAPAVSEAVADIEAIGAVFSMTWRPSYFSAMLDEGRVDLDYFSTRFGLFGDAANRQIRVELPGFSKVFQYASIAQDKGWLVFSPSGLRIRMEGEDSLLASWSRKEGTPADLGGEWKPGDEYARFISLEQDMKQAVRMEEARRSDALKAFVSAAGGEYGAAGIVVFGSEEGGSLEIWPGGTYEWKELHRLPAGFAPEGDDGDSSQAGLIVPGLRLSPELAGEWQGGFSLYPENTARRTDYVYRLAGGGMTLALAAPGGISGEVSAVDSRPGTVSMARQTVQR